MTPNTKPKVVKDYDKLTEVVKEQIKLHYPHGFRQHLITFKNAQGKFVSALPFETEDRYYLVRMTQTEATEIIEDDTDYNQDGILKVDVRAEYVEKYIDNDEVDIDDALDEKTNT